MVLEPYRLHVHIANVWKRVSTSLLAVTGVEYKP